MSQTSYSQSMAVAVAGMLGDGGSDRRVRSCVNPAVAIPFGCAVARGTDPDRDVKLPTSAAEAAAAIGIALRTTSIESSASGVPQYPVNSDVSVITRGRVWVTVTEAVTPGSDVYVRYGDGVADTDDDQKGGFSDTPDGTAQVSTLTPTAVNAARYSVTLSGKTSAGEFYSETFSTDADGSATATEICDALRTLINAATVPVTASGTATLILTADFAGVGFTVQADPNTAIVATTANAGAAAKLVGAKFVSTAAEDGLALVELNLP